MDISLKQASDYSDALKSHFVMASIKERREEILEQLKIIEEKLQVTAANKEKVLLEVLFLVEWPLLTETTFDPHFLKAPKELLVSEMVEHQRYFPLEKMDGTLINHFVITANNAPSTKYGEGNRRVLSARLHDGVFPFFEQDLKSSLDQWREKLKQMTFQKELGSVFDKIERLVKHTKTLVPHFKGVQEKDAIRQLCSQTETLPPMLSTNFPTFKELWVSTMLSMKGKKKPSLSALKSIGCREEKKVHFQHPRWVLF